MRDIWLLQPRLERRTGKSPYRLLENERFRAAYDFMLIRCEAGELDEELGQWWTDFIDAPGEVRQEMIDTQMKKAPAGSATRKRSRRSGQRRRKSSGKTGTEVTDAAEKTD